VGRAGPVGEMTEALPREFFDRPSLEVARDLLGRDLQHKGVVVRLTEVEAYAGPDDPASHAYRGVTPRNAVMFGAPGHLYVYFSYGMHWCANVVCGPDGTANAVLLRAGRAVSGLSAARSRRVTARSDDELARGPARLTASLGIGREQDGLDLCRDGASIRLSAGEPVGDAEVAYGPRVGVSQAVDVPWRLWVDGDPTVSPYRAGRRGAGGSSA
jgi:DNA-3-methyladenine glycosylase